MGLSVSKVWKITSAIFSLGWVYRIINYFLHLIQRVVGLFSTVLEGGGGVLWTLVLLVLIVTLFSQIGSQ